MNYKFLFPTFRNRYRFIGQQLKQHQVTAAEKSLNLGTGEGDYDALVRSFSNNLVSCDINERDIAFAKELNRDLTNVVYRIEDALDLTFADNSFDLIISVEVLEHVGKPDRMMEEVSRVLKPGGIAMLTFPRYQFPVTYDPINRWFRKGTKRYFAQGAYAFGHDYLVKADEFESWCAANQLKIIHQENLSGALIGLFEAYWTGIVQRMFKDNATNLSENESKKRTLRPTQKVPGLVFLTDAIIQLDKFLFGRSKNSIGKGYVVQKVV